MSISFFLGSTLPILSSTSFLSPPRDTNPIICQLLASKNCTEGRIRFAFLIFLRHRAAMTKGERDIHIHTPDSLHTVTFQLQNNIKELSMQMATIHLWLAWFSKGTVPRGEGAGLASPTGYPHRSEWISTIPSLAPQRENGLKTWNRENPNIDLGGTVVGANLA